MLDINEQNPDFKYVGDTVRTNSYYDIDFNFEHTELYGTNALDQAIENLLLTEYGERLYNYGFGSPLSDLFFENNANAEQLKSQVYAAIENIIPIRIIRTTAQIGTTDADPHILYISLDYNTLDGKVQGHHFNRKFKL